MNNTPSFYTTLTLATLYVLSGVIQPLVMEIAKQAGLTDNKCQIYMFAYYLGTASVCLLARNEDRLSLKTTIKTASVASIDIIAQTLNYTGMVYAGPTLFAIIYSSGKSKCSLPCDCLCKPHVLTYVAISLLFYDFQ